jgi:N-acetylglutamate synthase-like GNAT family acetyltransferase
MMPKVQTDRRARLHVREISSESLDDLITLLASEGLPTDDVAETDRKFFAFSDANGSIVGYGGLERAGEDLLLRSVVTTPAYRGAGHGRAITEWLIGAAARNGPGDLYLLTTTAPDFFAKFGFKPVERTAVPQAIANSREFSSLCPQTAITMKRSPAGA